LQTSKLLYVFFFVHVLALLTSIALLNLTTGITILYFLYILVQKFVLKRNVEFFLPKYWQWFLLYVGITFISAGINFEGTKFRDIFIELRWVLSFFGLTLLIAKLDIKEKKIRIPLYVILAVVGCYAIYQGVTGHDIVRGTNKYTSNNIFRTTGFFSNPIRFSNVIMVYFCFLLSFMSNDFKNGRYDFLKIFSFLSLSAALYYTQVRGAWIAIPVVVTISAIYYPKRTLLNSAVLMVLIFSAIYTFSDTFRERTTSITNFKHANTVPRFVIWETYTDVWLEHFWFGAGPNNSPKVAAKLIENTIYEKAPGLRSHSHNQLLNVLSEFGVFAGIAWIFIIYGSLRMAYITINKNPGYTFERALAVGGFTALISLVITGITESNLILNEVTGSFVFVLALIQTSYSKITA
jgi:putative inorganic carbon (hco3(-)) transporter